MNGRKSAPAENNRNIFQRKIEANYLFLEFVDKRSSGMVLPRTMFFKKRTWLTFNFHFFYLDVTPNILKKFATLLPNNWLAETR